MKSAGSLMACLLAGCWLLSQVLPVAVTNNEEVKGWTVLLSGWLGPFAGQFGWFANPVFAISIPLVAGGPRAARANGIAAAALLLLTASAFTWHDLQFDMGKEQIRSFGPGYYLWFLAMFGAAAAMIRNAMAAETKGAGAED